VHLRSAAHDGRGRQHAAQSFRRQQHLVEHFGRDGEHPALRPANEREAVHAADRHVHDAHRRQRIRPLLEPRLSAAALDQQELVQPRMAMRLEGPVMQHRARRNGLAMHDIGQIACLAEQIVGLDRPVCGRLHVRIVQDEQRSVHLRAMWQTSS
jgi:hypothetical protein